MGGSMGDSSSDDPSSGLSENELELMQVTSCPYGVVLCSIVLYCVVLCCIVLYCVVLCCVVLCCLSPFPILSPFCLLPSLPFSPHSPILSTSLLFPSPLPSPPLLLLLLPLSSPLLGSG